jgi:DNA helicase-2/ATP-dependent DNA helicase PcrA
LNKINLIAIIRLYMQHNKLNQLPIIREYNTAHQDFNQLITSIEALLKSGVAHQQIAVVYNEANGGESLFAYFTQNKLAYTCSSDLNLLNLSLSHQIILLLKYIAAEYDMPASGDDVLFQILHFKWFNIPHIAIANLTANQIAAMGAEEVSALSSVSALTTAQVVKLSTAGITAVG